MANERALPDLKTRFKVDYSSLTSAEKAVAQAHGQFQSGAAKSKLAAQALEGRLTSMSNVLTHLGPVGASAGNALSNVGSTASATVGTIGLLGGVALGAGAALVAGAVHAEQAYENLVTQVEAYKNITGSSAEESSRAVYMFKILGINADTAQNSMFKLSRAVAEHADKLEALGVHIQTNEKGEADLTETLYAVADAYDATSDATKRAEILVAAFGKGGAAMIDVVKQGSARLRELAAAARAVITDDDIQQLREYKIRVEEAKSSWDEFWASLGQKVIPVLDASLQQVNKATYVQEHLNQAVKEGKISEEDLADARIHSSASAGGAVDKLTQKYEAQFDAQERDAHQAAILTETLKEQTDQQHAVAKATDDAVNALQAQASAQISADRANIAITTSQDKVNAALTAYHQAVKQSGKNSADARQALADYKNAVLDQEDAYLQAANAAGKLARAQHDNTDEQEAAKASVDATIAKFEAEARTLAPNSPLRKQLEAYIAELKRIPIEVGTTISLRFRGISAQAEGGQTVHGNVSFDEGGRPPVGRAVIVGGRGPEIAVFDQPATIYPHGQMPPAMASGMNLNRVEQLLEALLTVVGTPPTGQGEGLAALFKATSLAGLNRMRGMAGS